MSGLSQRILCTLVPYAIMLGIGIMFLIGAYFGGGAWGTGIAFICSMSVPHVVPGLALKAGNAAGDPFSITHVSNHLRMKFIGMGVVSLIAGVGIVAGYPWAIGMGIAAGIFILIILGILDTLLEGKKLLPNSLILPTLMGPFALGIGMVFYLCGMEVVGIFLFGFLVSADLFAASLFFQTTEYQHPAPKGP